MASRTGPQSSGASLAGFLVCVAGLLASSARLPAQDWIENTHLIDVRVGSDLSDSVREYSRGGYELSDGTPIRFGDWYSSGWRDLSVTLLTEVNRNFGILWGVSTGEAGEKYRIDPAFKIGVIIQTELSSNAVLSFSATALLWGHLTEKTCIADYGAIGGVQKVNCRLAATPLRPRDTLDYLFDEAPADQFQLKIGYVFNF